MIVQPDFLDHWKTSLLIDLLDDECAPLYVIRLWGHCQSRKTHRFPRVNPAITKAICKAPHDAEVFENAMISAGFIQIEGDEIVAHEWDSVNAYLVNSWVNGKKGGRPKKITQTKPTGNPELTQAEPIREEKINIYKADAFEMVRLSFCKITKKTCHVLSATVQRQIKTLLEAEYTQEQFDAVFTNAVNDEFIRSKPNMLNLKYLTSLDAFQAMLDSAAKVSSDVDFNAEEYGL